MYFMDLHLFFPYSLLASCLTRSLFARVPLHVRCTSTQIVSHSSPIKSPRLISSSNGSPTGASLRHLPPELIKTIGKPKLGASDCNLAPRSISPSSSAPMKQPSKKVTDHTQEFRER